MLNHLMLATLDPETQREWEIYTASHAETPTTAELVTFLVSRCRASELLQTTQSLKSTAITPCSSQPTGGKVSKPIHCNVATQLQCPLCDESHRLYKCDRFLKLQPRQHANRAKQLGLYFNCLQPYFKGHSCSR